MKYGGRKQDEVEEEGKGELDCEILGSRRMTPVPSWRNQDAVRAQQASAGLDNQRAGNSCRDVWAVEIYRFHVSFLSQFGHDDQVQGTSLWLPIAWYSLISYDSCNRYGCSLAHHLRPCLNTRSKYLYASAVFTKSFLKPMQPAS